MSLLDLSAMMAAQLEHVGFGCAWQLVEELLYGKPPREIEVFSPLGQSLKLDDDVVWLAFEPYSLHARRHAGDAATRLHSTMPKSCMNSGSRKGCSPPTASPCACACRRPTPSMPVRPAQRRFRHRKCGRRYADARPAARGAGSRCGGADPGRCAGHHHRTSLSLVSRRDRLIFATKRLNVAGPSSGWSGWCSMQMPMIWRCLTTRFAIDLPGKPFSSAKDAKNNGREAKRWSG